MNTPFIANTHFLKEEPQYDMMSAGFFSDPKICKFECKHCPVPELRNSTQFMDQDQMIQQLNRYRLLGAELVLIRGGEPALLASALLSLIDILRSDLPVRIHTSGSRPQAIDRLKSIVDGFCVDIKIPMRESYDQEERDFCERVLGNAKSLYAYREALRDTVDIVDGMEFTYYTCSTYEFMSPENRQSVLSFLVNRKSPFLVGREFKTLGRKGQS